VSEFDEPPPWWIRDAVRGGFGLVFALLTYDAWTSDYPPEARLLLSLLVITLFAWYVTAIARWRREHRVRRDG